MSTTVWLETSPFGTPGKPTVNTVSGEWCELAKQRPSDLAANYATSPVHGTHAAQVFHSLQAPCLAASVVDACCQHVMDAIELITTKQQQFAAASLFDLRQTGIARATAFEPTQIANPQFGVSFEQVARFAFCCVAQGLTATIATGSPLVQLCIPVLPAAGMDLFGQHESGEEPMLRAFVALVPTVHHAMFPDDG